MCIEFKTIGALKGLKFIVPAYQRGYRWTEEEVHALLDDIQEFNAEGNAKYCIQPLMVKRREDGSFEVVDGQQRLTTIYIFMRIASQEIRSAVSPFELEYDTRKSSATFLQSLSSNTFSYENIDFHHISKAYQAINSWLERQSDKSVAIQKMNTKIRENVSFVWYELPVESDVVELFTNINSGKIPLTNAELIKALLLNRDNFGDDASRRQTEISLAWDRIEQGLQDDSFWYFLNQACQRDTRIDMLFQLLANEWNARVATQDHIETGQPLFPFLVFYAGLESASNKDAYVRRVWDAVEQLYEEFRDWYSDLDNYHIIGYLIASGKGIADIFKETHDKRKSEIRDGLVNACRLVVKDSLSNLEELDYDSAGARPKIRKILLLFNIATLVRKSEKQYRFPFAIYKQGKWDIEHIHATADGMDEADDNIRNLTLLDSGTNRSYKDKPFLEKRKIIMERESQGLFVPLCTKNIFLKAYSAEPGNMDSWDEKDKDNYIKALTQTLGDFLSWSIER